MNKTFFITGAFLALGCGLMLTACSNEDMADNLLQEPVEARVSASIGSMATRAADTQWADGDAIGITGGIYTDIRYVYSNGSWTVDEHTIRKGLKRPTSPLQPNSKALYLMS